MLQIIQVPSASHHRVSCTASVLPLPSQALSHILPLRILPLRILSLRTLRRGILHPRHRRRIPSHRRTVPGLLIPTPHDRKGDQSPRPVPSGAQRKREEEKAKYGTYAPAPGCVYPVPARGGSNPLFRSTSHSTTYPSAVILFPFLGEDEGTYGIFRISRRGRC
jgi:hypothetical protein